ncbi:nuclease-related domain-containing protein [Sporosarcina koreensis]|uniref:Nuclease-related domain-containing protein n=1 Tax=Sporosarcina koreensis TaxID=334735 RepID=A0ABW0U2D7_9BACL
MLYKKRKKPLAMLGLQALLRRLPKNHQQYIRILEDFRKRDAGFSGEVNFDKHIKEFRPSYPYGLLHDVCLNHDGVFFQMDSLLITPASIVIFEIKNLGGKIVVKANPTQFIQENNGERKVIQSPITELDRKIIFLNRWLEDRGFNIPIRGLVGLAFTNELFIEEQTSTPIVFTHEIPILLYGMALDGEKLGRREIGKIANEMTRGHQEYNPFPMIRAMDIPKSDILTGVICPNCNRRGMEWLEKKWICIACGLNAIDCHHQLINEWFYLIDDKMTNGNFRRFAGIKNRHISKRILRKSGLRMKGNGKAAVYFRESP